MYPGQSYWPLSATGFVVHLAGTLAPAAMTFLWSGRDYVRSADPWTEPGIVLLIKNIKFLTPSYAALEILTFSERKVNRANWGLGEYFLYAHYSYCYEVLQSNAPKVLD